MPLIQTGFTPNLGIARLTQNRGGNTFKVNDAITKLDMLAQFRVLARSNGAAPGVPDEGDAYLLTDASTGFGAGAGQHDIAFWSNGWQILEPQDGWRLRVLDEEIDLIYIGADALWREDATEGSVAADIAGTDSSPDLLKVVNHYASTTSDATARLPTVRAGMRRVVINDGANDIEITPQPNGYIDALAMDAARSVPAGKRCIFIGLDDERWSSILSA